MEKEVLYVVKELNRLKGDIWKKEDNESISYLILAAIKTYNDFGKLNPQTSGRKAEENKLYLQQLETTGQEIKNGSFDLASAKFQASASLTQLTIALTGLSVSELDELLETTQ